MRTGQFSLGGILFLGLMACGCASSSPKLLTDGYAALGQHDYAKAAQAADQYLKQSPTGPGSAEALWLHSRAIYDRPKTDAAQRTSDLATARLDLTKALSALPVPRVEALVRSDLANIAYFQDDYATADQQWQAAYSKLDDNQTKAWALYRIGLCRQRMGRWAEADAVFDAVRQRFANTVPAQRAREHQGAKGFYVKIDSGANQDAVVAALKTKGVAAVKSLQGVMVGPESNYMMAVAVKDQLAPTYGTVEVVP